MGEDFEECLQGSFDECYQPKYIFPTTTSTTTTTTTTAATATTTTTAIANAAQYFPM